MLDLTSIKGRWFGITPGPWRPLLKSKGMTGIHAKDCVIYHAPFDPLCLAETHARQKADAEFIAHARTDIPALVDEVEQLRAEVDELTKLVAWYHAGCPAHSYPVADGK